MAIREIRVSDFDQECAKCGAVRALTFSSVEVGVARDNQVDGRIIPLPSCASCGATEFLLRSPVGEEHPSQGSYGHKHRLLVDMLHARLVQRGRLAEGLKPAEVPTKEPPAAVIDRWFKDGLRLDPPPKTDGDGR